VGVTVARRGRRGTKWLGLGLAAVLSTAGLAAAAAPAAAATNTLNLKVLLIGNGSSDVTTGAWEAALTDEGVPFDEVTATGTAPNQMVTLPALTSSTTTGNYNGVVIADDPADFASGQLGGLYSYESTFGVRQVDGYAFPTPTTGQTLMASGALDGTTGTLTAAGLSTFPELNGPVPFDTGTFGFGSTAPTGGPFTPLITDTFPATTTTPAQTLAVAGIYQHPTTGGDPQAGVSELALNFNYNASQLQWLLLAPGLISWVTQDTHLGLYRSYFGQDIDDNFIADNEWSQQFQCTPAATNPPDFTCPTADQGVAAGSGPGIPADVQMTAADVAYVVNWEQQTGITLNMAFNAIGACTAPTVAAESSANCTGSVADSGGTFTDPGQVVDTSYPDDQGLVNALLADKADFNWIIHTWSHLFLGCQVWQGQALTSVQPGTAAGTLAAGSNYSYEITAATAYGESEPSTPQSVAAGASGSVDLTWPEATNGTGTDGTAGPTLAQLEANFGGGTGAWGYNIYREDPGSSTYGFVGHVDEDPGATAANTYSFTDTGTAAGAGPDSDTSFPSATNPGIDCASAAGSWLPATTTTSPDASIEQEIGLDQAFGAANALPNYTPAAVVTGEHSGLESPNMTAALAGVGVTTFAQDGSRQPNQYTLGAALGAPRYPSNIYYNAGNWPDELNEYNTLYVAKGVNLGNPDFPTETGHCTGTSATTCLSAPLTEAGVLASESHIMLGHVLANNPRVGYAHQSDLIGPATDASGNDYGYTILDLISNMLAQYKTWYNYTNSPLDPMNDVTEAQTLQDQSTWASAENGPGISASITNGTVTVANSGAALNVPVTVPAGTTVNGAAFGQAYGGTLSDWVNVGTVPLTLVENVGPTITSAASATSIVGAPFTFTVTTTGAPTPTLSETGALPAGLTFTDNGNGTATIAGTSTDVGANYPITITATNGVGNPATQTFTLTNASAPTITSPATATFTTGVAGTYTVTTTGFPVPTLTLSAGTLPDGLTFVDNKDGTGTIAGTPATTDTPGIFPVSISATNVSGGTATLDLTITLNAAAAPILAIPAADFTVNLAGSVLITTTGSPTPKISITSGTLPSGLTITDNGNGTATIGGTATATGTTNLTIGATNGITPDASEPMTITVGQAPAFTSAATATATVGSAFSFTVATTGGSPVPLLAEAGALPSGITFKDNGDGTATLSGTPDVNTAGTYPLTFTATNLFTTGVTQAFTLTVQQAPAITSANSATFTVGTNGTFTVTTTGSPTPNITESGTLPQGVTLVDNSDGTATLSGTPAATDTVGTYPITITASNKVGSDATQSFTLTLNAAPLAPTITSGNATTFTVGTQGSFSVTSTGNPVAAFTYSGTLPSGVTLMSNGDGTATLAGIPASGSQGTYPITITATNGVSPDASQAFTLTVVPANAAPLITSANGTTFAAGAAGTFSVITTGYPTAKITDTSSPALPPGVTLKDNGDGTATLAGTPPEGSQGTYTVSITATNSVGAISQNFTLTVNSGLAITSPASATATSGQAFSFPITTTGTPAPTLSRAGTLPPGITFTANSDGTATLAGTPTAAAKGIYPITFTARNSTGTASQAFTLTVANMPAFTSAATATETAGTAFTFTVNTTGYPAAALSSGSLPTGVSFSDNGNGTGSLSGSTAIVAGTYPFTLTATNSAGATPQNFTLTVRAAGAVAVPTFTSAASAPATAGTAFNFTVTTVGSPTTYTTNVTRSGTLPAGLRFTNLGNGTATITGTPTAASGGTYPLTFTARNTGGTTTQSFVLTVSAGPTITTAASATATVGSSFSFTVKANGAPAPAMNETGTLPQGLTWTDNGNGTATLAGTPGVDVGGVYSLTFSASNTFGTTTQNFTLTVRQAPSIISASSATATHGVAMTPFTFQATGYPLPNVTHSGTVRGLTYTNNGNGKATLSGTPRTAGTYTLTITARNAVGTATQTFTLTVS
jgi:Putative Ig domain